MDHAACDERTVEYVWQRERRVCAHILLQPHVNKDGAYQVAGFFGSILVLLSTLPLPNARLSYSSGVRRLFTVGLMSSKPPWPPSREFPRASKKPHSDFFSVFLATFFPFAPAANLPIIVMS